MNEMQQIARELDDSMQKALRAQLEARMRYERKVQSIVERTIADALCTPWSEGTRQPS